MSKNIRKRREKLWFETGGICYYCGVSTFLPPRGQTIITHRDDLATLDHLRSRLHKNRILPNLSNEERTVLSCLKCNFTRGKLCEKCFQEVTIVISADKLCFDMDLHN